MHLHVHSQYSLLDRACQLERLIQKAAVDFQMPVLALTNHGKLLGAIDFSTQAQKEGLRPIIRCELYVTAGAQLKETSSLYASGW